MKLADWWAVAAAHDRAFNEHGPEAADAVIAAATRPPALSALPMAVCECGCGAEFELTRRDRRFLNGRHAERHRARLQAAQIRKAAAS